MYLLQVLIYLFRSVTLVMLEKGITNSSSDHTPSASKSLKWTLFLLIFITFPIKKSENLGFISSLSIMIISSNFKSESNAVFQFVTLISIVSILFTIPSSMKILLHKSSFLSIFLISEFFLIGYLV